MPVKERLSDISLYTLTPLKFKKPRITIEEDALPSKPFIIPKRKHSEVKFTGRQRELDYLRTLYSETIIRIKKINSGGESFYKPIAAGIKGEAGIGKSRLVKEFSKRISSEVSEAGFISGGSYSSGQNPYGLISNLIRNSFGITQKLSGSIYYSEAYPTVKDKAGFLSHNNITLLTKLVCGNITEQNRTAINNAVKEYLFGICSELNKQNIPLVITLEDMQWADEPSLEVIEHILKSLNLFTENKQPQILFIFNYRSRFKPSKTLRSESDYREVMLERLSDAETERLITALTEGKTLNGKTLNDKTRELIVKRSEGSPFNLEEWCRLFTEGKNSRAVPATVKGMLAERVSLLEADERAALIAASVLGRKFELKIVNEILKQAGKEQATEKTMQSLAEKRYLVNLTGDVHEFRHDILQETIYGYLKRQVRQNVHQLAGEAIEELYKSRLSEHYYELARHYAEAKSEAKSIEYLEKAGDKAKNNYEHERAIMYYQKLLKKVTGENKYRITFKLCDVYMNRSEWNKQIELCKNILAESLRLDKKIKAECYKRIGHAYRLKGDYKDALKIYKKAYRIHEANQNVQGKLDIMEREAKVMMVMGKYKESLVSFETIYKVSKENNYNESFKNALIGLGIVSSKIAMYNDTLRYNDELYVFSNNKRDKQGVLTSNINKAEAMYQLGRFKDAYFTYKNALKIAINIKSLYDEANCMGNIGAIFYMRSNYRVALKSFMKQLEKYLTLGDRAGVSRAIGSIGACYISLGIYNKALEYLGKQLNLAKELNRFQSLSLCLGNIGAIYGLMGEFDKAQEYYSQQIQLDKKYNNIIGFIKASINIGIMLRNKGDYRKAIYKFQKALSLLKKYPNAESQMYALNYLAESMFEEGFYEKAILFATQTLKISNRITNKLVTAHARCIQIKAQICKIIMVKTKLTKGMMIKISCLYNQFGAYVHKSTKTEEKAIFCYEQSVIFDFIRFVSAIHLSPPNIKLAEKLYIHLYQKHPQFIYRRRIIHIKKIRKKL